jgi:ubiquinone/menaquinone biosynthesis C-methylase UbiE
MQDISFPDSYFDAVIANHVLEHVSDDTEAIGEVTRVLKPGGIAILQTPYSALLPSSIGELTPSSPVTRDILFGEPDHMRLYGLDVFDRIAASGLQFIGGSHASLGIQIDSAHLGVNGAEPFFLFRKL